MSIMAAKKKAAPQEKPVEWETTLTVYWEPKPFDGTHPREPEGCGWEPVSHACTFTNDGHAWSWFWKRRKT